MTARPHSTRFYLLDGMRGIAALAVMMFHCAPELVPGGHLAVDFFFCLSGFVIALTYGERLRSGELGFGRFVALRIARLYPMVLVGGLLGMIAYGVGPRLLLLLPETFNEALFPGNPPYWSLLAELAVNLLFAAVLVRLSWRWTLPVLLASAATFVWLAGRDATIMSVGLGGVGGFWPTLWPGVFRALTSFVGGMLLLRLWQAAGCPRKIHWWALAIPVALLGITLADPPDRAAWELACALLVLPALTFAAACVDLPETKVCSALGDLSYPLYCTHMPAIYLAVTNDVPALIAIAAIGPVAWLIDRVYDRPVRGFLTRLVRSPARSLARA